MQIIHQFFDVAGHGVDEEVTQLAGFHHHQAAVHRQHADAHGQHDEGFQDFTVRQEDEEESEQYQEQSGESDFRGGDEKGVQSLKDLQEHHIR